MKKEETQLDLNNYDLLTILGQGSFSKVRLVKKKGTSKYSCVKMMKKIQMINGQQVDHIYNQYTIMKQIQHPFVVHLQGMSQNNKMLYFFMEFISGGQLFTHLRQQGMFDSNKSAFYAAQITLIFEYLHSKNIIFRDLKPQNILIAPDGFLKLGDFGFAKIIQNRTFTLCGTPQYLAPEILENKGHGKPVDWWTLGVLIYQMVAGIDPFANEDPMIIYKNILNSKIHYPKGFNSDAKSLVRHLLVRDLSKRYGNLRNGANDIKQHRYFKNINLTNLLNKKLTAPYRPNLKGSNDTSKFVQYTDSFAQVESIKIQNDPFLKW